MVIKKIMFLIDLLKLKPFAFFLQCYSRGGAITVGLPPDWVDVSEEISVNIQRARTKMAELGKAHAKALMPTFGDGKEDQHQIESLTQEITFLLRKSEKQLQKLSAAGPSEDSNVRKNVQVSALLNFDVCPFVFSSPSKV